MPAEKDQVSVAVRKDGPYIVSGNVALAEQVIVADANGDAVRWQQGQPYDVPRQYALCRCGQSSKRPFCDGTHVKLGFDGTEVSTRTPYAAQARTFGGPVLSLLDATHLCADARFCDPNGKVWNQVTHTDDPQMRETFLSQVHQCPAGRLIAYDKAAGKTKEPDFPISIGLVEDPAQNCSGPIWLRGGIPLTAADGHRYEVRKSLTLCRCGASKNKPFCDGAHASIGFKA
jgi:CDGSH-type Zn-finger protein